MTINIPNLCACSFNSVEIISNSLQFLVFNTTLVFECTATIVVVIYKNNKHKNDEVAIKQIVFII